MLIHLDPVGGVAGDMFIAAITDAFPHLREGMLEAIRAAGLPGDVLCGFEAHRDHGLTGSRFRVEIPTEPHRHTHGDHGEHQHRHHVHSDHIHHDFSGIRAHLLASPLTAEVKHHAIGIFTVLAAAESGIHGHSLDEVSFHELGEWDSIADIVGAAYLIASLDVVEWTIGTLPLGSGYIQTAHGRLPVPVPATAAILQGYAFADDGVGGERVTPTGAAIVRHLNCHQKRHLKTPNVLVRCGYGLGTRSLPGLSNTLRALAFETENRHEGVENAEAVVIQFEVDDQTPEDLATGLDRLRGCAGVLDVLQSPVVEKKGRMAVSIQVLAEPDALEHIVDACFLETTTIGLRHHVVQRRKLPREMRVVQVGNHSVRVKLARRTHAVTAKAESDDAEQAEGSTGRMQLRQQAEAAGLRSEDQT